MAQELRMKRKFFGKWIGICVLGGAACLLSSLSSCARNQQLIGITVQPSGFTFLNPDPAASANFTAIGTYIHPAENKDITSLVTWSSSTPQLVTVSGGAVSPTGNGCGGADISASYDKGTGPSGNDIIGYASVTVDNPLISTCPGGTSAPVLSVTIAMPNTPTAMVVSSPGGIDCPSQSCGSPFASGTVVTLTATPSSSFVAWGTGCTATANTCQVVVSSDITITATFQ
jgi:hypothetical protein